MKKTLVSTLLSLALSTTFCQVHITSLALNTGGSFFENGSYMISGNIGEMSMVNTFFASDFIITNGLLQPLITKKTGLENFSYPKLKIYPTIVASNFVYLESSLQLFSVCKIKVHNSIGQTSINKTIALEGQTQISKIEFGGLGVGSYFLEVTLFNIEGVRYYNQVFKIQKM